MTRGGGARPASASALRPGHDLVHSPTRAQGPRACTGEECREEGPLLCSVGLTRSRHNLDPSGMKQFFQLFGLLGEGRVGQQM